MWTPEAPEGSDGERTPGAESGEAGEAGEAGDAGGESDGGWGGPASGCLWGIDWGRAGGDQSAVILISWGPRGMVVSSIAESAQALRTTARGRG